MSKRKHKRETAQLFASITNSTAKGTAREDDDETESEQSRSGHSDLPIPDELLVSSKELAQLVGTFDSHRRELTKMKKFRFQLLHQWILGQIEPCRMADVGGGKGLLAYLLQNSGWHTTVIDPSEQGLPNKYKDLASNKQTRIASHESVRRISQPFAPSMVHEFDLLVAMHAHGCNLQLIDAIAEHRRSAILLPCCIIHEPIIPALGVHWIQCVVDYALEKGLMVTPFRLNFKGQNIGLYIQTIATSK